MLRERELRETCEKLAPIIGSRRSNSLWLAFVTSETPRARLEAEGFIELVALKELGRRIGNRQILLVPPGESQAGGEFQLGELHYGDEGLYPLFLRRSDLNRHILICGITGSGKTTVAYNLLAQLLDKQLPFLVVDWKRSYRQLRKLDPSLVVPTIGRRGEGNLPWNPLRPPPGVEIQTWISVVAEALERSHVSGQGVADVFIDLIDDAFSRRGFYEGNGKEYPNFFDARDLLLTKSFKGRRQLWSDSCLRILRSFTFGAAKESFNARNPIHLEELLDRPVVVELDQELPKPLRVFFSDLLLRWIHLFRLGQGERPDLQHLLVLEEVHNLLPRGNHELQTTNSLENVFREIRSFGQGIVGLTQHPSLLPIYLLGNSNTLIILGLQHQDDMRMAARSLYLDRNEEGFLDQLAVGEGIVKIKGRATACYVKFPPSPLEESK